MRKHVYFETKRKVTENKVLSFFVMKGEIRYKVP